MQLSYTALIGVIFQLSYIALIELMLRTVTVEMGCLILTNMFDTQLTKLVHPTYKGRRSRLFRTGLLQCININVIVHPQQADAGACMIRDECVN